MELDFESLDERALGDLVTNRVPESTTLDYKRALPGSHETETRKLAVDIAAMANTRGGIILYGVKENDRVPVEIPGVEVRNFDQLDLRLQAQLRSFIEPRLVSFRLKMVDLESGRCVVAAQVGRSWLRPHCVRVKQQNRYHARSSAGNFELDVGQLRRLVLESEFGAQRMKHFRFERLAEIQAGESPLLSDNQAVLVLHFLPAEIDASIDLSRLDERPQDLPLPHGSGTLSWRYNFEGFLTFWPSPPGQPTAAYTQVFRNGAIEAVAPIPGRDRGLIASTAFERNIRSSIHAALGFQEGLGVGLPIYVGLTLLNVRGFQMGVSDDIHGPIEPPVIDRDQLHIPVATAKRFGSEQEEIVRQLLDIVWNSAGWDKAMLEEKRK